MAESDDVIPPCATRRRASFASSDITKYRRSFDGFDFQRNGTVQAKDLQKIIAKLGYRMTQEEINVSINILCITVSAILKLFANWTFLQFHYAYIHSTMFFKYLKQLSMFDLKLSLMHWPTIYIRKYINGSDQIWLAISDPNPRIQMCCFLSQQDVLINNELDESSHISFEKFLDIIPRNYEQIPEEEHK